ncbi:MAG: BON domain-containing protein [Deltaproteobacteria bacterium]|nr:BON domain-containing protein [Nannocystaceae bacterium]
MADLLQPCELAELEQLLAGDDEVRERLGRLLEEHGLDAAELAIDVSGGRVHLAGVVADPLTSLLVEDLAWSMPQVRQCQNTLQVRSEASAAWSMAS